MTAKIIVKCIIYNRALNRFLLVQRCENDHTGANTWRTQAATLRTAKRPKMLCSERSKRKQASRILR